MSAASVVKCRCDARYLRSVHARFFPRSGMFRCEVCARVLDAWSGVHEPVFTRLDAPARKRALPDGKVRE